MVVNHSLTLCPNEVLDFLLAECKKVDCGAGHEKCKTGIESHQLLLLEPYIMNTSAAGGDCCVHRECD